MSWDELSWCTTTIEPVLQGLGTTNAEPIHSNYCSPHALEPVLPNKKSHINGKLVHCNQRAASTPCSQRKGHTATKPQYSQKRVRGSRSKIFYLTICFYLSIYLEVQLIYNLILVSGIQLNDSVLLQIIFHSIHVVGNCNILYFLRVSNIPCTYILPLLKIVIC